MISWTKLDSSFFAGQAHINGFSESYRFNSGKMRLYICNDVPFKTNIEENGNSKNLNLDLVSPNTIIWCWWVT